MNLQKKLLAHRLILKEEFYERAAQFAEMLLAWNKVHNMSGAKTEEEVYHHIYDSVYPLTFLGDFSTVLDIGTGAGFPGLAMAMAKENAKFVLVEPLQKRAGFLSFAAATLGLENVRVVNARIEQVAPTVYDLVTSRAVSDAATLYGMALPFMDKESRLLLFKGRNLEAELSGIEHYEVVPADHTNYVIVTKG